MSVLSRIFPNKLFIENDKIIRFDEQLYSDIDGDGIGLVMHVRNGNILPRFIVQRNIDVINENST